MKPTLHLKIVTLDRELYNDIAFQVSMPTPLGEITVLPHHAPLITSIVPGEAKVIVEEGKGILSPNELHVAVGSGFVEIANNTVTMLVDSAERVDEIELEKVMEAKKKAEDRILALKSEKKEIQDVQFADASAELARQLARLKVGERKRRHHRG